MRALYTAATGMNAQQHRMDSIANNIANVNTTGFKKSRVEFQDLFYQTLRAPGAQSVQDTTLPTGAQIGHGVRLGAVGRVFTDGDRVRTDRGLDVAIEGDGFFQVEKPGGETVYTRSGNLQLDRDGNVVTPEGYAVLPAIQVPIDTVDVTILRDGSVSAVQVGSPTPVNLGQMELARFANPAGLRGLGGNLFAVTEASGDAETGTPDQDGFGGLNQGFLESSNVNIAEELVQLILAQRGFEMNSRVIQAGDEMMRAIGSLAR